MIIIMESAPKEFYMDKSLPEGLFVFGHGLQVGQYNCNDLYMDWKMNPTWYIMLESSF